MKQRVRWIALVLTPIVLVTGCSDSNAEAAGLTDAEFRAQTLERFDGFGQRDDGSTLDPADAAKHLCTDADWGTMKSNLGADWDGSFQKFAAENYCPENL